MDHYPLTDTGKSASARSASQRASLLGPRRRGLKGPERGPRCTSHKGQGPLSETLALAWKYEGNGLHRWQNSGYSAFRPFFTIEALSTKSVATLRTSSRQQEWGRAK